MKKNLYIYFIALITLLFNAVATKAQWQDDNNGLNSGRMLSIATKGDTVFAGTNNGGVYFTVNNGGSWQYCGLMNNTITSLIIYNNKILAGTLGGFFISADNGKTWNNPCNNNIQPYNINSLAVNGNDIYAGTSLMGVFKTDNGGISWVNLSKGIPKQPNDTFVYYNVYALAEYGNNLIAGTDLGVALLSENSSKWVFINKGLPKDPNDTNLIAQVMSLYVINNNILAGTAYKGVYFSSDTGKTWNQFGSNFNEVVYNFIIQGNKIFTGTLDGIYYADSIGKNWNKSDKWNPENQVLSLVVKDTLLFIGTNRGIYISSDSGKTWSLKNEGLHAATITDIATLGKELICGLNGGGIFINNSSNNTWQISIYGLQNYLSMYVTSIAISGKNIFAATYGGVYLSADSGQTWITANTGLEKVYVNKLISSNNKLIAGTTDGQVFISVDNGSTWKAYDNGLTTNNFISGLAAKGDTIYAATEYLGVYISTNGGTSWVAYNNGIPSNGGYYTTVYSIDVDKNNIYISDYPGGILVSSDNGKVWNAADNGITNVQVNPLFVSGNKILTADYAGDVFLSNNQAQSWEDINSGLNNLAISVFGSDNQYFYAGSSGNGVYRRIISNIPNNKNTPRLFLDTNNVKAAFNSAGSMFWDLIGSKLFEVPKGSGKGTIFAGTLWVSGKDESGNLHMAAERYRQVGADYWQGPVRSSYTTEDTIWNNVWKINKSDINNFKQNWNKTGYVIPDAIKNWPAKNAASGEAKNIAPFYDNNNDGNYNPTQGDYPIIRGDQAVYFIFNDDEYAHTESGAEKLGIEVHAMAYAYNTPSDTVLNNTIFLNYQIINRSQHNYDSVYISSFTDPDIGYGFDDFIGCDTILNSYFGYNGTANDGLGSGFPGSYGLHPPAESVTFLNQKMASFMGFSK